MKQYKVNSLPYTVTTLKPSLAYRMESFASVRGTYIKRKEDDGDVKYQWDLKRVNLEMQILLLNFHFPLTMQDSRIYAYVPKINKNIELSGQSDVMPLVNIIRRSYGFTSSVNVGLKDIMSSDLPSSKSAVFPKWDGTPRLMTILDEFFDLNPEAILLTDNTDDEQIANQMRLSFAVWLLQYVARRKGYGRKDRGDIQYGVAPLILSEDKGIGKSSFLSNILTPTGNTRTATLSELLDPLQQGRLFAHNIGLILDEVSPFELRKNLEKFKEVVTNNTYRVEEKFMPTSNEILRETAIVASSNRPVEDFSFYETDRRLQIITVSRKENPTDFDDYPFEQVTAEASAIIDSFEDKRELKRLLRWGVGETLQVDGNDTDAIYGFLHDIIGKAVATAQVDNSTIYNYKDGYFLTSEYIRNDLVKNHKALLPLLGFKGADLRGEGMDGELPNLTGTIIRRRLMSYIMQFRKENKGQFKDVRYKNQRGFYVSATLDNDFVSKSVLDVDSLGLKQEKIETFYQTTREYHTAIFNQIVATEAWGEDRTELPESQWRNKTKLTLEPFNNRLVVLELKSLDGVNADLPIEEFERDGKTWYRVFFWLNDDNMDNLWVHGTYDIVTDDIHIYQSADLNYSFTTTPTWVDGLAENKDIGLLLYQYHLAQLNQIK